MNRKDFALNNMFAVAVLIVSIAPAAVASSLRAAPAAPYEAWSTHKTTIMSADKMGNMSDSKTESSMKIKTMNGQVQTMKLSAPLGKL